MYWKYHLSQSLLRHILLLSIIFLITQANTNCFVQHRNFRLKCVTPTGRRPQVSLTECQRYCLSQPADCLSAQYDFYRRNCEIFNTPSPLDVSEIAGNFNDMNALPYESVSESKSIGRYRRKRNLPEVKSFEECIPSIQRSIGVVHLIPNISCLTPMDKTDVRHHNKQLPQLLIQQLNRAMTEEPEKPPKNPFAGVEVLPIVPDCPIGERARIQIIDGVDVATPASVSLTTSSPEQCIECCRSSIYPDGRRLPLLCRSSAYNRLTSICSLFHDSLNPNGYLEYQPDYNVLYMEKICVAEKILPLSCDDVFRRVPQHIILGHAAEIVTSASQLECVRECIEAKNRQLDCRSVLHYIDVPVSNCILNIHTRNSRPEYFVPELKYKVDYIELSPCALLPIALSKNTVSPSVSSVVDNSAFLLQNSIKKPSITIVKPKLLNVGQASVESEWSEWTICDPTSGIRERDRVCTDCDDRIQTQACIPNSNNEFEEALKKFVKDREDAAEQVESAGFPRMSKASEGVIPFPNLTPQASRDGPVVRVRSQNSDVEYFGPPMNSPERIIRTNELMNDFDLQNPQKRL